MWVYSHNREDFVFSSPVGDALRTSPIGSLKPNMESKHTQKPPPTVFPSPNFFFRFATVALLTWRAL